jgi:sugar phosphate isomerase/epimerase
LQIGVASELLRSVPLPKVIDQVAAAGFTAIEVWVDHWRQSGLKPKQLLRCLRASGLEWSMHADARDVNLISTNKGICLESIKQTKETIRLAAAVEARVLTIHPGRLSSTKDRPEDFWPQQIEVFQHLAQMAAAAGVQLGVENMEPRPGELIVRLADMQRLLGEVDSPNLGSTLDLAHLYGQTGIEEFAAKVPRLVNVHLSDARPGYCHLPLGQGNLEYSRLLDALDSRYRGFVILEGFSHELAFEILPYLHGKWQEHLRL